ncbi:TonB family protein [Variovorax sp. GB1P17]|uniref:TonB family protein n=1 Tax=Variovorax sp. GB1P17 TaxID=3443740 RepID=UPI003F46847E
MTRSSAPGGALTLPWCLFVLALMIGARMAAAQNVVASEDVNNDKVLHFDLQVQSLETALALFGNITGHSVLVAGSLISGRRSAVVQGDFAPRQALRRMLDGTGLVARYSAANAFTLIPEPEAEAASAEGRASSGVATPADTRAQSAYAHVLQNSITRVLCIAQPDAFGRYRLGIQLWIDPTGRVENARLLEGSGIAERDAAVLSSLRKLEMDTPPPGAMAQPVTILLTPRADPARECRPFGPRTPSRAG